MVIARYDCGQKLTDQNRPDLTQLMILHAKRSKNDQKPSEKRPETRFSKGNAPVYLAVCSTFPPPRTPFREAGPPKTACAVPLWAILVS